MTPRGASVLLAACATLLSIAGPAAAETGSAERGHQIALTKCSRCHAVEAGKTSPVKDAPPFYTFARMWPVDDIAEALAEGIMVGHGSDPMSVFQLDSGEIDDLIAYLKTIQTPADKPAKQ